MKACAGIYNDWWGFTESPFNLSPDPLFFYASEQHQQALAKLIHGVESRKGFIALTGEVGTGKTTLLECLRADLNKRYIDHLTIANSMLSVQALFEVIAHHFRYPSS